MAAIFGSRRSRTRSIAPKRVVPRSEDTTSKAITKPRASSVSTTASSKPKSSRKVSFARPVKRAPVKSARFTKSSSISKVTRKSPIGSVSTGRTMRRTVDLSKR